MTAQLQRVDGTPDDTSNPVGTDGFEFVEYTAPDPAALASLFTGLQIDVEVIEHPQPVLLVDIATPTGLVRLESTDQSLGLL